MARRSTKGGKASKARKSGKVRATGTRHRNASPAAPRRRPAISGLRKQLEIQTIALNESLEQQAATARILSVIASSPTDIAPVLKAIVESACDLCDAGDATVLLRDGDDLRYSMHHGPIPIVQQKGPISRGWATGRAFVDKTTIHIHDWLSAEGDEFPEGRLLARKQGHRTLLCVPLLREGEAIGVIALRRTEARSFSDKQIALLQTFADQAVIAIQNTRLFNDVQARTRELSESLQQQTATSEVLQVISASPGDLAPVFDKMLENATRVCGAEFGSMIVVENGLFRQAALYNAPAALAAARANKVFDLTMESAPGMAIRDRRVIQIEDVRLGPAYLAGAQRATELVELGGARSLVVVPLLRDGVAIGAITVYRQEVRRFDDKQIDLLTNFARQAVIAIENVRLFNETREALERQTATADILKVIASSPADVQPVFDAIADRAKRLVGGHTAAVSKFVGDVAQLMALTPTNPEADALFRASFPRALKDYPLMALVGAGETAIVADSETDARYVPAAREAARLRGFRSLLLTPLVGEDGPIGLISVARKEPGRFAPHHVELLKTFADQAVIAIQNVELFDEVQAKSRDLEEALTYRTGSANILSVIASSPTDVAPTLKAIVESACEICGASDAVVLLRDGDDLVFSAHHGPIPFSFQRRAINRNWVTGRAVVDKATQHVGDLLGPEGEEFPEAREIVQNLKHRTILSVPLLREDDAIGAIMLRRDGAQPFDDKQIELLKSFADQAVIAINNVNLFEQVQQRTRELSQSLDDLRTAQDRLVQTEKLASLGQLTAGIAHEIKNPLNFVNNFSALSAELIDEMTAVLDNTELDEKSRRAELDEIRELLKGNLEKVIQHGKRADSIVKNMLLHSRQGSGEHRPVDINVLIEESLNLAYHGARAETTGFNITLERDFDPSAGAADVYPQEITRVLLNLISNGFYAATRRAAEAGNGFEPKIMAATKNLGDKVEIRVRDNGTGIPSEIKDKVFTPFFTTKPAGEGTGLGLSMSHDIVVKQHGGTIDLRTEPGSFTEFIITLPRDTADQKSAGAKP